MQIDELTVGTPTRNKARNILVFLPFCPPQLYLIVVDASPDSTLEMVEVHRPERPLVVRRPGTVTEATKTPVIGLTGYPFPLYPELKLVSPYIGVVNLLKTFKPDMLYLVNLVSLGLVGLRYAHRLGLPVLASYHTDIPDFIEQWGFDLFINPIWTYLR